jgi:hypothetical protein
MRLLQDINPDGGYEIIWNDCHIFQMQRVTAHMAESLKLIAVRT